jgi:Holliday junction resolvasome RuvABC endonuclease subunit
MGIAIFEGVELVFWGVTSFRNSTPDEILQMVEHRLRSLIEIYDPTVVVVEKPTNTRQKSSPLLQDIVVRISITTIESLLYYQLYSLATVKERLCNNKRATRQDMIKKIIAAYPHLSRYTSMVSKWQEAYWMPMFAAVAVGMICINKQ